MSELLSAVSSTNRVSERALSRMKSASERAQLDREYNAFLSADGFDKERIYRERSAAALHRLTGRRTFAYDTADGALLDVYPGRAGGPLFVWIHGGYWRASSKDENIFVAPALVARGIHVASIDYALAPSVSMGEIVRQVRQAIGWLYANAASLGFDRRRIHIGGHSAGGHLVGMLLASDWLESMGLPPDLFGVAMPISGLFELEPLRHTFVNEQLRLTDEDIEAYSPLRHVPIRSPAQLLAACGGKESSEFARQTDNYLAAWQRASNSGCRVAMPECHHFDIILALEKPGNPLFETLLAQMQQAHA